MAEHRRRVIQRYPEHEETVHALGRINPEFDALCRDYAAVADKLEDDAPITEDEAATLRRRREALEEEMLGLIEGYSRP